MFLHTPNSPSASSYQASTTQPKIVTSTTWTQSWCKITVTIILYLSMMLHKIIQARECEIMPGIIKYLSRNWRLLSIRREQWLCLICIEVRISYVSRMRYLWLLMVMISCWGDKFWNFLMRCFRFMMHGLSILTLCHFGDQLDILDPTATTSYKEMHTESQASS